MTRLDKNIIDLIEDAQTERLIDGKLKDPYKPFLRWYAGHVRDELKSKNPIHLAVLRDDIDRILTIIDPALKAEINWFKDVKEACRLWINDRILTHRALGIKNDNQ